MEAFSTFSKDAPPVVINETLIRKALSKNGGASVDGGIQRQKKESSSNNAASADASLFSIIQKTSSLSLSSHNIAKICNLDGFSCLTQLKLDNNRIKRIQHLEKLVLLEDLDLSFNRIVEIEGLETLTRLKTLSLFQNSIEEIEGLEHCHALEFLSLGNNKIEEIISDENKADQRIFHLQKCTGTKSLVLKGNPICASSSYPKMVLDLIPSLRFLDYESIKKSRQDKNGNVSRELCNYEARLKHVDIAGAACGHRDETQQKNVSHLSHVLVQWINACTKQDNNHDAMHKIVLSFQKYFQTSMSSIENSWNDFKRSLDESRFPLEQETLSLAYELTFESQCNAEQSRRRMIDIEIESNRIFQQRMDCLERSIVTNCDNLTQESHNFFQNSLVRQLSLELEDKRRKRDKEQKNRVRICLPGEDDGSDEFPTSVQETSKEILENELRRIIQWEVAKIEQAKDGDLSRSRERLSEIEEVCKVPAHCGAGSGTSSNA